MLLRYIGKQALEVTFHGSNYKFASWKSGLIYILFSPTSVLGLILQKWEEEENLRKHHGFYCLWAINRQPRQRLVIRPGGVMVNLTGSKNHLGEKPLGMSTRHYLDYVCWGRKTHFNGWTQWKRKHKLMCIHLSLPPDCTQMALLPGLPYYDWLCHWTVCHINSCSPKLLLSGILSKYYDLL